MADALLSETAFVASIMTSTDISRTQQRRSADTAMNSTDRVRAIRRQGASHLRTGCGQSADGRGRSADRVQAIRNWLRGNLQDSATEFHRIRWILGLLVTCTVAMVPVTSYLRFYVELSSRLSVEYCAV